MLVKEPQNSTQLEQPVLSYEAFQSANSIDELVKAYQQKGVSFDDKQSLLRQIASDFKAVYPDGLQQAIEKQNGTIEPTTIMLGDSPVHIYGVAHKKSDHYPTFFDELHEYMLNQGGLVFAEHGISTLLFDKAPKEPDQQGHVIEINDHLLGDRKSEIALGIYMQTGEVHDGVDRITPKTAPVKTKTSLIGLITKLTQYLDSNTTKLTDLLGNERGQQLCAEVSERLGLDLRDTKIIQQLDKPARDNHAAVFGKVTTIDPTLLFSSGNSFLPEYVDLELKNKQGKAFTAVELRSAYMAEFIREWLKDQPSGTPCNLVCGAFHNAQIAYFLTNGSPQEVCALAKTQVEKAKSENKTYKSEAVLELMKTNIHFAIGTQVGDLLKELGTIPGVAWGVHRLLDKFGFPTKDAYKSSIEDV